MKTYLKYFLFFLVAYFVVATPWRIFHYEKTAGWDHEIYCRAVSVEERGQDPYLTQNLGFEYSYAYPVPFLKIYKLLCPEESHSYIWVHFACLVVMAFLMVRFLRTDLFLTMAWLFLGFNSASVNYSSGNVGTFEAFFFVLFLIFYLREKWWSSVLLVPAAFIKVLPAAMIVAPIAAEFKNKKRSLISALGFISTLAAVNLITYLLNADLYLSFLKQVLGLHPAQHSPITEMDSNPSNISVVLFLKNLSSEIAPNSYIVPLSVLLIGLLFYSYWLWKRSIKSENDRLVQICWWILILLLWVPRLKPYSMLIAGIALVPILQRKSRAWAVGLLVLSIFHRVINGDKKNHLWYLVANNTAVYAFMLILFFAAIAKSKKTENNF